MRTTSALQIDDLAIGIAITVLRGRMSEVSDSGGNIRVKEDTMLKGNVLEIVSMDLPYILVDRWWQPGCKPKRIELNVGDMTFKALSQEYVNAYQCKR